LQRRIEARLSELLQSCRPNPWTSAAASAEKSTPHLQS
jgi:hypothetical protein